MTLRRRDEIEASEGRDILRLARRGGSSLLYTATVVAAIILVLFVSVRLSTEFDVSRRGENRLAPQTREVLDGLTENITLYALYSKQRADQREGYWNQLRKFRSASPRIHAEFHDPVARPGVVRGLGLRPEEEGQRIDGLTVAVRGEHRLPLDESVRKLTFRAGRFSETEEMIANAILELGREDTARVVGLLRGYGERNPESEEAGGFSAAVEALRREYYEVRDVWLTDGIPRDLLVLVAAGPRLPVPPAERERLGQWLDAGGRMLALLDPAQQSGLEQVLMRYGLRPEGRRIEDPRSNFGNDFLYLRVTDYSGVHEAVKGFGANLPTGLPEVTPVEHWEEQGDQFHVELASSSAFSYVWNDDGTRSPGPFDVAAASWFPDEVSKRRLVLIGDSDFASNGYLSTGHNKNFFLNCVAWLARQQDLMTIRRAPLAGQEITLEDNDWPVLAGVVLGAPMLLVLAGVVMFFKRRSL